MSIEDDVAFLERVPTLRLLGRTALRILAIGADSRYVHQQEQLFAAGEPADCAYVVQEGSFELRAPWASGEQHFVAVPGTLLGELALLTETKRPATAISREPSTVIRITRTLFLKMLDGYPESAHRLQQQLVARASEAVDDIGNIRAILDASDAPG